MSRLTFNERGELVSADQKLNAFSSKKKKEAEHEVEDIFENAPTTLKKSEHLDFLKDSEDITEDGTSYWSLHENGKNLAPLKFSNGKTQEDVVREIVTKIKEGTKVILLHGMCGTGKSAIALNIARALGKASIVVPVKSLQRQYEEDYMGKKFVVKDKKRMKIAMITGRENHDSVIFPGVSCADPHLPDTIKLTEKNRDKIKEYYEENPYISSNAMPDPRNMRRMSIAPANPHWSPILPAEIEIKQLSDAKKKKYIGMDDREYIFYHRKPGCSYYDQYLSYFTADVIIYNSAKYLSEVSIGRKPKTEVDIIDEADEFLDKLSNSIELNLTRLGNAVRSLSPEAYDAKEALRTILKHLEAEETHSRVVGVNEDKVYHIDETKIGELLKSMTKNAELETEIETDEMNYANTVIEAARQFEEALKDTYLTYRKDEDSLFVRLVTTNLSKKFQEIIDGNKAVVLMSGTLHSDDVLEHIFGIKEFAKVEAETLSPGMVEIMRVGKEFDCRYSNFSSKQYSRADYLGALNEVIKRSTKPSLIHVNAFSDLPSSFDEGDFHLLMLSDELRDLQRGDKNGQQIIDFKNGKMDVLFTTKCGRGVDFPGEACRSVIFTKYPNPNVKDTFWKILQKTHPHYYWEFYRDRASREFLQRIYRAVRSKDDHVFVMSPDLRVLNAVRDIQLQAQ